MDELLKKIQQLQLTLLDFENYTLSVSSTNEHISAHLHDRSKNETIAVSLGFVHRDYPEKSGYVVDKFVSEVMIEILDNN